MEQINNNQARETFLYPNLLPLEAQKQILKCPFNHQAYLICSEANCEITGLMCIDPTCLCRQTHFKCHHLILDRVLKSIYSHHKQIPSTISESYKQVYQNINDMIDDLSEIREKLQKQQFYFGLTNVELQFIELISQNKIEKLSGKVVSLLEYTFQAQLDFSFGTPKQIKKKFQEKRVQFDKILKFIENSYSKSKIRRIKLIDSEIITELKDKQLIDQWLLEHSEKHDKQISYNLLFRASQNKFKASQFHRCCDGILNTLVIVKGQNDKVFGGFTQKAWFSPASRTDVTNSQNKAFMFSLNMKQKYECTKLSESIKCDKDYGPIFGGGCDLYIRDNCFQQKISGVNTFYSYNLKIQGANKYESGNQINNASFAGCNSGNTFRVKQYEVYQIE